MTTIKNGSSTPAAGQPNATETQPAADAGKGGSVDKALASAVDTSLSSFQIDDSAFKLPLDAGAPAWNPSLSLVKPGFDPSAGLLANLSLLGSQQASFFSQLYPGSSWGRATRVSTDGADTWRSVVVDHYGEIWAAKGKALTATEATLLAEVVASFNHLCTLDGAPDSVALPDIKDIDVALRDLRASLAHQSNAAAAGDAQGAKPLAGREYQPGWNDNLRSVVMFAYQELFEGLNSEQADLRLMILMARVAGDEDNRIRDITLSSGEALQLPSVEQLRQELARVEDNSKFISELKRDHSQIMTDIRTISTGALVSLARLQKGDGLQGSASVDLDAAISSLSDDVTMLRWDRAFATPASFDFFGLDTGYFSEYADDPQTDRTHLPARVVGQTDEEYIRSNWPTTEEMAVQLAVGDPQRMRELLMQKLGGPRKVLGRSAELARDLGIDVTQIRVRRAGSALDDLLNQPIVEALANAGIVVEWRPGESFESIMRQLRAHPQAGALEHLRTLRALAAIEASNTAGLSDSVQGPPTPEVSEHGVEAMHHQGLLDGKNYNSVMQAIEAEYNLSPEMLARLDADPQLAAACLYALLASGDDLDINNPVAMAAAISKAASHLYLKRQLLAGLGIDLDKIMMPAPSTTEELEARLLSALRDANFDVPVGASFHEALAQLENHPRSGALEQLAMERMFAGFAITDPDAFDGLASLDRMMLDESVDSREAGAFIESISCQLAGKPKRRKVDHLARLMAAPAPPESTPVVLEAAPVPLAEQSLDPGAVVAARREQDIADKRLKDLQAVAAGRADHAQAEVAARAQINEHLDKDLGTINRNDQIGQKDPNKKRGGPLSKG